METKIYNKFLLNQYSGNAVDLRSGIKVALFTDDYDEDIDTEFFSGLVGTEASGDGYDAGGKALENISVAGDGTVLFSADDTTWTNITFEDVRYLIIYRDTGNPASSRLIEYVKLAENKTITAGTFTIEWDTTDKIIKITTS